MCLMLFLYFLFFKPNCSCFVAKNFFNQDLKKLNSWGNFYYYLKWLHRLARISFVLARFVCRKTNLGIFASRCATFRPLGSWQLSSWRQRIWRKWTSEACQVQKLELFLCLAHHKTRNSHWLISMTDHWI